jgi:transposase InsO family protein
LTAKIAEKVILQLIRRAPSRRIFVERLWRSVKYEEVYLKDDRHVPDAITGLRTYFEFYNRERLPQSLNYQTPEAVYRQGLKRAADDTRCLQCIADIMEVTRIAYQRCG